jgi:hypothetical protein
MDTRLLRFGTHDAVPGTILPNGSGFDIDLGNVFNEIGQDVIGFSTECIGFYNLHPNINTGTSDRLMLRVNYGNQATTFGVTIPNGQYNSPEDLASALITAVLTETEGLVVLEITVNDDGRFEFVLNDPLNPILTIYPEGVIPPEVAEDAPFNQSNRLATILGLVSTNGAGYDIPVGGTLIAPGHYDLGGERVAFLHSSYLTHDRSSVDGDGAQMSAFVSAPINVPYNNFNLVYPNQYEDTAVFWGRRHEVRNINFRLRNIRGELLNVQGTEWFATIRLFLKKD